MSRFGKNLKYGANTVILSIVILSILVIINFFSSQYHFHWDFTKSKKYSLSEQTKKVLSSLKNDIKITCFFQEETPDKEPLKDLLKEYSYLSKRIKFEFIDPDKNPKVAKRYRITEYSTIFIETENRENQIKGLSEQDITNAIIKITRKLKKVVYFIEGHGEKDIEAPTGSKEGYSMVRDSLIRQSYEVKKISLLSNPSVPADCSVLVISGPKKEFFPKEKEVLNSYLLEGGKALFLLDPDSSKDMDEFLKGWMVNLQRDFIVDKMSQIYGGDYFIPVVNTYGNHEITKNFHYTTFYPLARSLSSGIGKEQQDFTFTPLAMTSNNSWAEKNTERIEFNPEQDQRGPLIIACAVTNTLQKSKRGNVEVVVFGDSDFVSNAYFGLSGNGDLFLNSVNWLAEEQDLISIRPKLPDFTSVQLTKREGDLIFFISVITLPSLILISGGIIWIRRRRL